MPAEDPAVYEMIQRADTIGVFQIESRAQMSMLPRLKPKQILRPGHRGGDRPSRPHPGGHGPSLPAAAQRQEAVEYPKDAVREVLEKTLGVPLFQEQAMKLVVVAAGFTPGEADRLRRAMGAWRQTGVIEQFEQKLIQGMLARGYTEEFARNLFRQIRRFRVLRIPRVACRIVRPAGVRFGLDQVPSSRDLPGGLAEQPADGVLRACTTRGRRRELMTSRSVRSMSITAIGRPRSNPVLRTRSWRFDSAFR